MEDGLLRKFSEDDNNVELYISKELKDEEKKSISSIKIIIIIIFIILGIGILIFKNTLKNK